MHLQYNKRMTIAELRLANLRSYELFSRTLHPNTTLILGKNGTGKTTLLEALYTLMQGTSFRGRDADMIAHNTTRSDLQLTTSTGAKRSLTLQLTPENSIKKVFKLENKTSSRLPTNQRLGVVLFEPNELRSLSSSPERRRAFFDGIIARTNPSYAATIRRYQRALTQRNELLKKRETTSQSIWNDQLFAWDIQFSDLAKHIVKQRRAFVEQSNQTLSTIYSTIAGSPHETLASYRSPIPAHNYQQTLLDTLSANALGDSYRGYTSHGPHRDDILLSLDGHLVNETASRGELRTIMLAYKLYEVQLQQQLFHAPPLVLLDDVFSELDTEHEQQLIAALAPYQTIITATDLRDQLTSDAHIIHL